ncbi:Fungalysin metallopeptidase-domain-containing protein [Mycena filopes]|nr:Fungalysin metallopeptidase-domain-containing protein [Mycena filopes]
MRAISWTLLSLTASCLSSPLASSDGHLKYSTHRTRNIAGGAQLQTYHPPSTYKTFGRGIDHPLSKRVDATMQEAALAYVQSELGIQAEHTAYHSGYAGEIVSHAYIKQAHNGIFFANAVANVAIKDGKVVAMGHSFVQPTQIAPSTPSVPFEAAVTTAENALGGTYNGHPATMKYFAMDNNSAALVHAFQVQNQDAGSWYEAYVNAHSNELVSVVDFVSQASYLAVPISKKVPTDGFDVLEDPQDLTASPKGWHWNGTDLSTTTDGNNVATFRKKEDSGKRVAVVGQSAQGQTFNYPWNPTTEPNTAANRDAALVNNFFVVNTMHDILYRYGFTEVAFNFQRDNFGKGGKGNDQVEASVQDPAGIDNANFAAGPEGQNGRMQMFLFDNTSPERDGALENAIVIHEYTHGLTNRMTGGGTGSCLQSKEAGGLGEGWSDAVAEWVQQTSGTVEDYVLGQFVNGKPRGIRSHPYSTSKTTNPLTYASVKELDEVHNIGEVWANMLHNVYADLVGELGFSSTAHTDPTGSAGNVVYLHLLVDALAIQPCQPTFLNARDAWIQADQNRYGGNHTCTLWKAFASRGLGSNAADHTDDDSIPSDC